MIDCDDDERITPKWLFEECLDEMTALEMSVMDNFEPGFEPQDLLQADTSCYRDH